MAKLSATPKIDLVLTFSVNESEARALDALAGYGDDAFIKHFYETLGKAYMEPHEKGLREFLSTVRHLLAPALRRLDDARKTFNE